MTGQGRVRRFSSWLFLSQVRMMEKAARSLKKRQKGKRITRAGGQLSTLSGTFLLLGKEKLGEENWACS